MNLTPDQKFGVEVTGMVSATTGIIALIFAIAAHLLGAITLSWCLSLVGATCGVIGLVCLCDTID